MTDKEPYQYDTLPSEVSLRILSLKPGVGNDPLVVTLETFRGDAVNARLADTCALSYVWGRPMRDESITCNQRTLKITSSLKEALEGVRDPDSDIFVWADAIAINQDDMQKRNHQIKLMTQIYSQAKEVLVWLGAKPGTRGKQAFDDAEHIATDPSFAKELVDEADFFRVLEWGHRETKIQSLSHLLRRPWFHRMWTLQEIGLARSATFVWGSLGISWEHLARALTELSLQSSRGIVERWNFDVHRVTTLYQWQSNIRDQTFLELLKMSTNRSTSDPRDRVFALLTHPAARIHKSADAPVQLLIEANYTMSEYEVYREIASTIIQSTKSLDIISSIDYPQNGLPSWVPNWSYKPRTNRLSDSYRNFAAAGRGRFSRWDEEVNNSLGPEQFTILGHVRKHLQVKALVIGNVAGVAIAKGTKMSIRTGWRLLERMISTRTTSERLTAISGEDGLCMYRDAITCGTLLPHPEADAEPQRNLDFEAYWYPLWKDTPKTDFTMGKWPGDADFSASKWPGESFKKHRDSFKQAARYAWRGRRFFCTDTGYFGLCPLSTLLGDQVCVFQGGRVPYVIRQSWASVSDWELIGECHVPGIMHGEYLLQAEAHGVAWESRTLV
jgi:hypothetical protein